MIRGIGPVYAKKMVKAFGEKIFDVIEAEPNRLREVTCQSASKRDPIGMEKGPLLIIGSGSSPESIGGTWRAIPSTAATAHCERSRPSWRRQVM